MYFYHIMVETTHLQKELHKDLLKFLAKKFPFKSEYSEERLIEIRAQYRLADGIITILQVASFIGLPLILAILMQKGYAYVYRETLKPGETFYPIFWFAFLPCTFFLGLILTMVSTNIIVYNLVPDLIEYYNDKKGYDNKLATTWFNKIAFILSLLTLPFTLSCYLIVNNTSFKIKTISDFSPENYNYAEVKKICYFTKAQAKDGSTSMYKNYEIEFKDSKPLKIGDYLIEDDLSFFINDLSKKSGVHVDSIFLKPYK